MVKKLNVYFIHAKYIKERESVIQNFKNTIKKYKFRNLTVVNFQVVEDFDPSDIDMETVRQYVNYNKIQEPHVEQYNQLLKNLHINQLSNSLKHYKAMELISKNSNDHEMNLILEDDVLYEEKICYSLDKLAASIPSQYDMIFLGMPTNQEREDKSGVIEFQESKKTFGVVPFCDSYLISHSACKAMLPHYSPIKFVNNIQIAYVCDKIGLTTLQSMPNMFIDGSKYGMFLSKLSNNNPLIFNGDFTAMRSIVNKESLDAQDINNAERLLAKTPLRGNPDFMHLECIYHVKNKAYEKARQRFEEAYNIYNANGCVLGNDSVFLRDYIRVHKHLGNLGSP